MEVRDISAVLEFVQELRHRLDVLEKMKDEHKNTYREISRQLDQREKEIIEAANRDIAEFVSKQNKEMISKLDKLVEDLKACGVNIDYTPGKVFYTCSDMKTANEELLDVMKQIAKECQYMNETDFFDYVHPVRFEYDEKKDQIVKIDEKTGETTFCSAKESYDSVKGKKEISVLYQHRIRQISELYAKAHRMIEAMGEYYTRNAGVDKYSSNLRTLKNRMLTEYEEQADAEYEKKVTEFLKKEDGKINEAFFQALRRESKEYEPDYGYGSDEFSSAMTLGAMRVNFSRPDILSRDMELIGQSPFLSKNVSNGAIDAPMILDYRKKGNMFIDVQGSMLSDQTVAFVHQYIQQFLLMQPTCRVNLCLADFNDQCKFNRYAPLKRLNQNALFKGIIRNEREIDGVINEVERLMYDIGDNKLSATGVSSIFDYNAKSKENPQSMHLLVLLDFPEKYTVETITHIAKIVANGGDAGMYTLIIRNSAYTPDFGSRMNTYDSSVETILRNSIYLKETQDGYALDENKTFVPLNSLAIDDFMKNVFEVLDNKANEQKSISIAMQEMFDMSDRTEKKSLDFSKLIEVPIGKNGGNVQGVKFSTTGDSSAHALVIGGTGSGKSNLLHALILSACYRYTPKELQIYLIDFKGGVEFKYYESNRLPHIRLTGLTSEPEDGVAILTNIRAILRERENTFRRNNVEDIVAYNALGTQECMPRILVIIDEVQELFAHERLSQQALAILGELFKKGRAFGISILWASQTVPQTVGGDFKDKVLSQIGNRICLKLNNADDAEAIGISASKVRQLNRPEKGLGIIFDGMDYVEFRVAFASDDKMQQENDSSKAEKVYRKDIVAMINSRWTSVMEAWTDYKPLFIVGDDAIPLAAEGAVKYQIKETVAAKEKSNEDYELNLGQDYVSGKPFPIVLPIKGTKENCWIAGKDMDVLRDMLGYAMLSVAIENKTNLDMRTCDKSILYFNGELISRNENMLLSLLPGRLGNMVEQVQNAEEFVSELCNLYRMRKERYLQSAINHPPVFVFIHKLQFLAELFSDKQIYAVSDDVGTEEPMQAAVGGFVNMNGAQAGFGVVASKNTSGLPFREIFKELWSRGSDVGIHFVVTVNDPCVIPEIRSEMKDCSNKIVISGVNNDSVSQMTDNYLLRDKVPTKEGVAFFYKENAVSKFKTYRYNDETESGWLDELLRKYL